MADGRPIGGLTAHELPMTRAETAELLIYDLAVQADQQRRGVGRALVQQPLAHSDAADIGEVWVPAENEDTHALEFYRRTGGAAQAVTTFTYPTTDRSPARSKIRPRSGVTARCPESATTWRERPPQRQGRSHRERQMSRDQVGLDLPGG